MLTPLVLDITRRLKRDPIPYLIAIATAANIGSVATITGNPQNLIIGQLSGISYLSFLLTLSPIALMGLVICWVVILFSFRDEFKGELPQIDFVKPRTFTPLLNRTMGIVLVLMIAFLLGAPIVTSACVAAALLLLSRLHPHKLLALDWDLLAFFAGLFAITRAIETSGLSEQFLSFTAPLLSTGVPGLSLMTAILSNLVSNVPAVLLLQTAISGVSDSQQAWLTLAMASTLAGNFTLLGSAATLIVTELARQEGVHLSFTSYLRVGIPITLLTLTLGVLWLMLIK
jgi:Na+/H+ antiporter NhaD/arsenite permease-like protein